MQPTSAINVARMLADRLGKSLVADHDWLFQQINDIRRAEWKNEAARLLKFKADGCVCAECFADPCATCSRSYVGITLPQNVTSLRYLEANGRRIDMTNERLGSGGCCTSGCGTLKAETLVRRSPLEHDIPKGYKGLLVFKVGHANDKGKRIGIEYVRRDGVIQREDLAADLTAVTTKWSPAQVNMLTFPERCSWLTIQTEEGYTLGTYHPSITAPAHYRLRLEGIRAGQVVRWEGLKEPHDVIFDTDLVEWDNAIEWHNLYQWLTLHFKINKNAAEQNAYVAAASLAAAGAESELAATQSVPAATLRPAGPKSLRRQIRRWNRL